MAVLSNIGWQSCQILDGSAVKYWMAVWSNRNLKRVNPFKYLGATLADNGDLDVEMTHRIQSGWKNWKRVSGILCDRRIGLSVKGKLYKTVVRPVIIYGAETLAVEKAQEKAEMTILRWMSRVSKLDSIVAIRHTCIHQVVSSNIAPIT